MRSVSCFLPRSGPFSCASCTGAPAFSVSASSLADGRGRTSDEGADRASRTTVGAFATFIAAVFWGTGAGNVYTSSPMRAYTCGNPVESFPLAWQPYADKWELIVALQGLAWANCKLELHIGCASRLTDSQGRSSRCCCLPSSTTLSPAR